VTALVLPGIVLSAASVSAQSAKVTKVDMKAPAPRLPNAKPDFSGNWTRPFTPDITRTFTNADGSSNKGETNPLPFTPWGQKQWDNYNQVKNGDYAGSCMPFGWIRSFSPHPMQILQNNEYVSFLFEQSTMFQLVNTEGLPHRKDWPATWFGDSRGRWEGDTLVIDVTNFSPKSDYRGSRENLHLVERWTRTSPTALDYVVTITDPSVWTRPWTVTQEFARQNEQENRIYYEPRCVEGNFGHPAVLKASRLEDREFAAGRAPDPLTKDNASGGAAFDPLLQ
jgi:hypothetical protein